MGWMARLRFLAGIRDFSLLHSIQTIFGDNPASYSMSTMSFFPGVK
jgi:hypothetical protein